LGRAGGKGKTMSGIHHVTAISGGASRNLDFYTRILGMRLVKKTVNFDDPGTYHLYYGDEAGSPGTILTFFPWEHAAPGRKGAGETQETAFRVPVGAIGYWAHRFVEKGVAHETPVKRFGQPVLAFTDPDGMKLALVGVEGAESETAWAAGGVPAEHAIRGFHGVTLLVSAAGPSAAVLTQALGFTEAAREDGLVRYRASADIGGFVDLHEAGGFPSARMGRGSVHHIAFRARDDAEQAEMARKLTGELGVQVTEQKNRKYFRSIYFREPGGVIFEIATDGPGFTVDEKELGSGLRLPDFLEGRRKQIEDALPPLEEVV
jgi:glyoxalase family protein